MYKASEIYSYLIKKFPLNLQEKWDKSGKITYFEGEVKKVLICLDINEETVNEAIKKGCNFIVAHHPIFIDSKEYPLSKKEKEIVNILKKNKISAIALHTCFDNNQKGMNYSFLASANIFRNIKITKNPVGTYATADLTIAKTTTELFNFLKIKVKPSRIIGLSKFKNEKIKKIALCCGSGFDVLKPLIENNSNIDLFLTGDVKWHDWQFANLYGVNLMDIGHDVENIFILTINKELLSFYDDLKIVLAPSNIKFMVK